MATQRLGGAERWQGASGAQWVVCGGGCACGDAHEAGGANAGMEKSKRRRPGVCRPAAPASLASVNAGVGQPRATERGTAPAPALPKLPTGRSTAQPQRQVAGRQEAAARVAEAPATTDPSLLISADRPARPMERRPQPYRVKAAAAWARARRRRRWRWRRRRVRGGGVGWAATAAAAAAVGGAGMA